MHRFWQGTIAGTYVGHGETYLHPQRHHLVEQRREAARQKRAAAGVPAQVMLEARRPEGIEPIDKWQDMHTAGKAGRILHRLFRQDSRRASGPFELAAQSLAAGMTFKVEILDTWNMTIDAGGWRVQDHHGRDLSLSRRGETENQATRRPLRSRCASPASAVRRSNRSKARDFTASHRRLVRDMGLRPMRAPPARARGPCHVSCWREYRNETFDIISVLLLQLIVAPAHVEYVDLVVLDPKPSPRVQYGATASFPRPSTKPTSMGVIVRSS